MLVKSPVESWARNIPPPWRQLKVNLPRHSPESWGRWFKVASMDPRKLLYLASIIEHGSLAKAAKHLSVSQPALSKSMDRLEAELGIKLLVRGSNGISPTKSGELIYSHARLIREEMDVAGTRFSGSAEQPRIVTFATLPSLVSSVMPIAVARWREKHPYILLRVVEKVQIELLLGLLRCEFDFIVGQTQFYDIFLDGLKQRVLFRDRLCVFARPQHPLFSLVDPLWADLAQYPWALPMVGWSQRSVMEKLMASEGVELPKHLVECGSVGFTKSLVASSDHLAMLPARTVLADIDAGAVRILPITLPALKRDIAVIFRERAPLDEVTQDLVSDIEAVGLDLSRDVS